MTDWRILENKVLIHSRVNEYIRKNFKMLSGIFIRIDKDKGDFIVSGDYLVSLHLKPMSLSLFRLHEGFSEYDLDEIFDSEIYEKINNYLIDYISLTNSAWSNDRIREITRCQY